MFHVSRPLPSGCKQCLMLAGINPAQSVPRLWNSVRQCRSAGAKVIVIDPRRTETAELADIWLQLRPGTDYALFLGMINVIIRERLYDKEFVGKWTYGFDKVAEKTAAYTPEKTAEITWVPADKIVAAARMYATNTPALFPHGMGTEHLQNASSTIQTRLILTAMCGNIDVRGREAMSGPNPHWITAPVFALEDMLSDEQKAKQIGSDRFKLLGYAGREMIQSEVKKKWGVRCGIAPPCAMAHAPTPYRAILSGKPYPVRAVFTISSNPVITMPNVKLVHEALKSLDLYVVNDFFMTPSAELADYVLPAATWLERPRVYDNGGEDSSLYAGEAALPASIPGEYDHKTDYEILRGLAARLGLGEFFPWRDMEESFDYRLQAMEMTFKGFMARGGNTRGKVRMKCQYFDAIDPRVVHAEHGWWFPEKDGKEPSLHGALESNINVLTDDEHCDPVHGGWALKTGLCKVYKGDLC